MGQSGVFGGPVLAPWALCLTPLLYANVKRDSEWTCWGSYVFKSLLKALVLILPNERSWCTVMILRFLLFFSVTVSVLSIEGTDCRLDELGKLADRTRGKVRRTVTMAKHMTHQIMHNLMVSICAFPLSLGGNSQSQQAASRVWADHSKPDHCHTLYCNYTAAKINVRAALHIIT